MRDSFRKPAVRLAAAMLAATAAVAWLAPTASADSNTDERDRQNAAAAAAKADVDTLSGQKAAAAQKAAQAQTLVEESSAVLSAASAKLQASQVVLADAQAALAVAQQNLIAAQRKDAETAGSLAQTQILLKASDSLVQHNQDELDAAQVKVGQMAREQYQQNTTLVGIATFVTPTTTSSMNDKLQWATTMFETSATVMTRLEDTQAKLAQAKNSRAVLEAKADLARKAAAAQLGTSQKAQQAAAAASARVQQAVYANNAAKAAAADAVVQDQAEAAAQQAEVDAVNARIAQRLRDMTAAQKAAAAADARSKAVPVSTSGGSSSTSGLASPIPGASITSPYGMRLHPVLHIWKLHDGTDFGAGCGTPIQAVAAGTVTEEYYNGGYGNRLFIDHGALTTSYNHMSGYAVRVGQHVTQGQVIGYVGTTGYSTGCHLHFMLWVNGTMVNPANYL